MTSSRVDKVLAELAEHVPQVRALSGDWRTRAGSAAPEAAAALVEAADELDVALGPVLRSGGVL